MAEDAKEGISPDDWAAAMAEEAAPQPAAGVFEELRPDAQPGAGGARLEMILDIPVSLSVELGRTRISIRELLQLGQGSVLELDTLAGEPMSIFVNGCLVAHGEVVVVNDKFGIRVTGIVTPEERLRGLNGK